MKKGMFLLILTLHITLISVTIYGAEFVHNSYSVRIASLNDAPRLMTVIFSDYNIVYNGTKATVTINEDITSDGVIAIIDEVGDNKDVTGLVIGENVSSIEEGAISYFVVWKQSRLIP